MDALRENDTRVAKTCRYLAEAHVQAMQFDEAENLCKKTLEIHREHSPPHLLTDRCLTALIYEAKGDFESALSTSCLPPWQCSPRAKKQLTSALAIPTFPWPLR